MPGLAPLRRNPWLAELPAGLADRLLAAGTRHRLPPGGWAYGEGDSATGLLGVLAGQLRLSASVGLDREALIDLAGPGAIFGRSRAFGGGARLISARAVESAEVLRISDTALTRLADADPALWPALGALVYRQLEGAVRLAAMLASFGPRARVAARLAVLGGSETQVAVTQSDLAELTGLSRKSVNGHLAALARAGAIERGYAGIAIRDRAALARFAGF